MTDLPVAPPRAQDRLWRRMVWTGMAVGAGLFAVYMFVLLDHRATLDLAMMRQANADGAPLCAPIAAPISAPSSRHGRRIEFRRGILPDVVRAGWSAPAPNFGLWSEGARASLAIPQPVRGRGVHITLRLQAFVAPGRPWQRVRVTASGRPVANWTIRTATPGDYRLDLPAGWFSGTGEVDLTFDLPDATPPASLKIGSTDTRPLAIALKTLDIEAAD